MDEIELEECGCGKVKYRIFGLNEMVNSRDGIQGRI